MPIVSSLSNLYRDPPNTETVDSILKQGRLIAAHGSVTNAADDLSGSKYKLATVPAFGIPDLKTLFDVELWGFAAIRVGTFDDVDALVAVLKSAGNTVTPFAFGDANHGLRWWQVLGLPDYPGGTIDLYAHAIANATGAGSMKFTIATWVD